MKARFADCLKRGKIIPIESDQELVQKELREAEEDLDAARVSLESGNRKWAIVQAYYAIFHSFRALLTHKGYREKSHICLRDAIDALYAEEGGIYEIMLLQYDEAKNLREGADYGCIYNYDLAKQNIEAASEIVCQVHQILDL